MKLPKSPYPNFDLSRFHIWKHTISTPNEEPYRLRFRPATALTGKSRGRSESLHFFHMKHMRRDKRSAKYSEKEITMQHMKSDQSSTTKCSPARASCRVHRTSGMALPRAWTSWQNLCSGELHIDDFFFKVALLHLGVMSDLRRKKHLRPHKYELWFLTKKLKAACSCFAPPELMNVCNICKEGKLTQCYRENQWIL